MKLPEGEDENEWLAVNSASPHLPFEDDPAGTSAWGKQLLTRPQWWTFTTRSTSSTAPSPSSARRSR
ncbi:hypothetical protein IMZ48_01030, partial [Candidatus Bathyarchaeota archaeon]|nr:hypothetical protein [Candidatus Bathyarchaeota archaeon]